MVTDNKIQIEAVSPANKELVSSSADMIAHEFAGTNKTLTDIKEQIIKNIYEEKTVCFALHKGNELRGVATINIFSWEEIKDQLYLCPDSQNGDEIVSVKLVPLFKIFDKHQHEAPAQVIELAFSVVLPQYRGKGYGRKLWNVQQRFISEHLEKGVTLILIRAKANCSIDKQKVLDFMLSRERIAQGVPPTSYVTVQGNPVTVSELSDFLKTPISLSYQNGVPQMTHLAIDTMYTSVGFSKNMCPVWIKKVQPSTVQ